MCIRDSSSPARQAGTGRGAAGARRLRHHQGERERAGGPRGRRQRDKPRGGREHRTELSLGGPGHRRRRREGTEGHPGQRTNRTETAWQPGGARHRQRPVHDVPDPDTQRRHRSYHGDERTRREDSSGRAGRRRAQLRGHRTERLPATKRAGREGAAGLRANSMPATARRGGVRSRRGRSKSVANRKGRDEPDTGKRCRRRRAIRNEKNSDIL